jgi:hypothetical protein
MEKRSILLFMNKLNKATKKIKQDLTDLAELADKAFSSPGDSDVVQDNTKLSPVLEKPQKLVYGEVSYGIVLHTILKNKKYQILTIQFNASSGEAKIDFTQTITIDGGFQLALFNYKKRLGEFYLK